MKFCCDKVVLSDAINTVNKVIPVKGVMPALEGILFNVYDDGKIKLTGFDLEVGIETYFDAEVEKEGSFIVNAKLLGDIVRSLSNESVILSLDDKMNMTIVSGVIQFVIPCLSADMFPDMPLIEGERQIKLKQSLLHSMVRQTIFAIAQNDVKPIQKGVLFDANENVLTVVASDYYRLALRKEIFEDGFGEGFHFIVPGKALHELIKIMDDNDDEILINLASKHVVFEFANVRIISRLLEGEFIKFDTIIPASFKTIAKVNTEEVKKAIERASLLIDEKIRVPVRFSFEYDSIIISCRKTDGHSFTDEVHTDKEGENLEIGFNNKQLLSILAGSEKDELLFKLNNPLSSMVVTGTEDDKFLYMTSPMRLRNE